MYIINFILDHLQWLDISKLKTIPAMISGFFGGMGFLGWIRLKRANRRAKIRTATLRTLKGLLEEHEDVKIKITFQLVQYAIFGVNAYNLSWIINGESYTRCIYTRYFMPDGHYYYDVRNDSIIFDLLKENSAEITNLAYALRIEPLKASVFRRKKAKPKH